MRQRTALLDMLVREARALVAEHERDVARADLRARLRGSGTRRQARRPVFARARGQRDRPVNTGQRVAERRHDMADARTSSALPIAIASGSFQERGATSTRREKPIVFSARGGRPDIAGMARLDEHETGG